MNKIIISGIVTIFLIVTGIMLFSNNPTEMKTVISQGSDMPQKSEPTVTPVVDMKASFAIFTNGTFRIFTDGRYHNLSSDVYIEPSNPNTVNVKKAGITWNDFFLTLPMKVTTECLTTGTNQTFCSGNNGKLQFYLNGEINTNALNQEIKDGDKLLITFGTESESQIQQQLDKIP